MQQLSLTDKKKFLYKNVAIELHRQEKNFLFELK